MKQMRSRVIAHSRLTNVGVDDGVNLIANAQRLFSNHLMRPHPLNRRVASSNFGHDGIVIVQIKPSPVSNLSAGVGIERRVIEDDLAGLSSLKFPRSLPVVDDSQRFAPV